MTSVIEFDTTDVQVFDVDTERRTMKALVMPWNALGRHNNGAQWRFKPGSLVFAAPKYITFNNDHDQSQDLGRAVAVEQTERGLIMTFKVKPGAAGDRALAHAASKAKTGFSVEIELDTADTEKRADEPGVIWVNMAHLTGVGFVKNPAFEDSRLISVRASRETGEEPAMPENTPTEPVATQPAAPATTPAAPAAAPTQTAPAPASTAAAPTAQASGAVTFSTEQFGQFMSGLRETFAGPTTAAGGTVTPAEPVAEPRPVVDPTTREVTTGDGVVSEPLPYRFSYHAPMGSRKPRHNFAADAEHDFSTDVFRLVNGDVGQGSPEAKRVSTFVQAAFADVDTTDVAGLIPKVQRPDMWYPQRDYATPLWDLINSGTTDGRPFELPKYNSSSGLVVAATEGVEPDVGAFTVTTQTITPTQLWGKVEITRQAVRRGGNPQISSVIWDQMLRSYVEAREAAVATFLATLSAATNITLTVATGASDATEDRTSVKDLTAALAGLQFVRGGNNFTAAAAQQDLYALLARVEDTAGRPLFPMINPMNADGTKTSLYRTIDVGGTTFVPAWALGAGGQTNPTSSWLFDPAVVRGWASQPDRLEWNFGATVQSSTRIPQLSEVTMGIYGDIALANIDINGVREIVHDPVGS